VSTPSTDVLWERQISSFIYPEALMIEGTVRSHKFVRWASICISTTMPVKHRY